MDLPQMEQDPATTAHRPLEEILQQMRTLTLERRSIAQRDKEIGSDLKELKGELMAAASAQGLEKVVGDGINARIEDVPTANTQDWAALHAWEAEQGVSVTTHARVSAKKLNEMAAAGVPLPSFIDLGSYRDVRLTGVK